MHPLMRSLIRPGVLGALAAGSLAAQTPTPTDSTTPVANRAAAAAATIITAADLASHLRQLATDSLAARATPSRGLELTAQYVAEQFRQFGLLPGNVSPGGGTPPDSALQGWLQRYPLPGQFGWDHTKAQVEFRAALKQGTKNIVTETGDELWRRTVAPFTTTARFATAVVPTSSPEFVTSAVMLVLGRHTAVSVQQHDLHDEPIFYFPPPGLDSAGRQLVIDQLHAASPVVVIVNHEETARFTPRVRAGLQRPLTLVDSYMERATGVHGWVIEVSWDAVRDVLAAAGLGPAQLYTDGPPEVRRLGSTRVALQGGLFRADTAVTAPNVVGILEGHDSVLKHRYVVISAHLDHPPRPADHAAVDTAATDNTVGIAALLALAQAFSRPEARPRHSVVFLATSGAVPGAWGSNFLLETPPRGIQVQCLCLPSYVHLGLELLGPPQGDALAIAGLGELEFVNQPGWVATTHPELGITVRDGGSVLASARFDQTAFLSMGFPSMAFRFDTSGAAPRAAPPAAVDTAALARTVQLMFYITQAIVDADRLPRWSRESRQRLLKTWGH